MGQSTSRAVDELLTTIDQQFDEPNSECDLVFEPIGFCQWCDVGNVYHDQGRYASASVVYRVPIESFDDNMERIDSAYDYFSRAFSRALDGYVDSVASRSDDADAVTDAVAFLDERATSGTSLLAEHFERAAVELRETAGEQSCEYWTGSRGWRRRVPERIASSLRRH